MPESRYIEEEPAMRCGTRSSLGKGTHCLWETARMQDRRSLVKVAPTWSARFLFERENVLCFTTHGDIVTMAFEGTNTKKKPYIHMLKIGFWTYPNGIRVCFYERVPLPCACMGKCDEKTIQRV